MNKMDFINDLIYILNEAQYTMNEWRSDETSLAVEYVQQLQEELEYIIANE